MSTWPFGLPVCDAAQPEDDGALVLLHDLPEQKPRTHSLHTGATDRGLGEGGAVWRRSSSSLTLTQNQMVMGKRTMTKRPDNMTKTQPTHPRDPVRSAGWTENRERRDKRLNVARKENYDLTRNLRQFAMRSETFNCLHNGN